MNKVKKIKKTHKFIEWSLTEICNYRCSYCIGGINKTRYPVKKDFKKIVNNLINNLSDSWRITLTGSGEPLMVRELPYIVKTLAKNGHQIELITNLSLPLEKMIRLCDVAGDNFLKLSASLHLEFANIQEFLEKARNIQKRIGNNKLTVGTVAVKNKLKKIDKIAQTFKDNGIKLSLQLQRVFDDKENNLYVDYTPEEFSIIEKYTTLSKPKKLAMKGKACKAGQYYFVISTQSDVWRCWPACLARNKVDYLGNLDENIFNLFANPKICYYDYCNCNKPILEGLIIDN